MANILLFAGTTEGRNLSQAMVARGSEHHLIAAIATEYGREMLPPDGKGFSVREGRMDRQEMAEFIRKHDIRQIIDATHPYAKEVSKNIREAAEETGALVYRLTRKEEDLPRDCIIAEDSKGAADFLAGTEGPVLLTTGSKELAAYTGIPNFQERLYPRMLPSPDLIEAVLEMGYKKQNLICMQGPFALETNIGLLKQTGAKYMVTKESGKAGGFQEKIQAAQALGVKVILIGRPLKEEIITPREAEKICGIPPKRSGSRFPLYVDVKDMPVLVVGGGKVAMRRAGVLRDFGCRVTVVASKIMDPQTDMTGMEVKERPFEEGDLEAVRMVVAATDDSGLNARIGELCRERHIPVNMASDRTLCDFYFPGIVRAGNVTVGVIAGGEDHRKAAAVREKIERLLHEEESNCR